MPFGWLFVGCSSFFSRRVRLNLGNRRSRRRHEELLYANFHRWLHLENCTHYKWLSHSFNARVSSWENAPDIFCFEWQEKAAIAVKGKLHDRWQFHGPPDVHSKKHWKSSLVTRLRKSLPIKWEQFEKAEDTLREIYNLIKCIRCH